MTDPETPTVERFSLDWEWEHGEHGLLVPDPDGEWVRHADYLTLQAECERLKKDNSAAVETLERALEATDYAAPGSDTDTLRKAIREALARLRQREVEKP